MSRALPLIIGGGALAYWWTRSKRGNASNAGASPSTSSSPLPGRWVWPVPIWQGRKPVISDGFGSPRPGGIRHGGVDVMYARLPSDSFRAGTPNGSKQNVMPENIVALAASDGVVWSATQTPRGFTVVIDHSPNAPVSTFYTHLSQLLVPITTRPKPGPRVRAGQAIGIIGADPLDPEHLKHLHFELWRGGPSNAVDPAPIMLGWDYASDPRDALVARNGSLVYRAIGATGEPYPDWVRELKGQAGVYVIRNIDGGEIVYVGSSSGRLYATLTRHFQSWRRYKSFWKGHYAEGHDPGLTYERDSVEVAVRLTSPSASLDEEMRLIARLRPRDNLIGQPIADEVPF